MLVTEDHKRLQGKLRLKILDLHYGANSGHIGCSLSCIDLLIAILGYKEAQDSFVLSKGHAASALYTMLSEMGDIPGDTLSTFYKDGTTLPAHPAPMKYKAIPFATGSLGHGLPLASGIAKSMKLRKTDSTSFVLMSDGETNEGTTWEAANFAVANKLDNLVALVDKNGLQGFGNTRDILGDTSTVAIWSTIGFDVVEADGHNVDALLHAKNDLVGRKNGKPKVIIASTVKGKGVEYMESRMEWHYLPMSEAQYLDAKEKIEATYLR